MAKINDSERKAQGHIVLDLFCDKASPFGYEYYGDTRG